MSNFSAKTLESIHYAAELFRTSKRAVFLTGAGISTPSGIPDFRSEGSGLWTRVDPYEVASLNTFRYTPERFFEWIRPLAKCIHAAKPNSAHLALAQLEATGHVKALITQNIDGLHQKAGSKNVLETHGSFQTLSCVKCFQQVPSNGCMEQFIESGEIPRCRQCSGILKPDVILFGEQLPQTTWSAALRASRLCDLMLIAGSSLEVLPVAGLPLQSLDRGAHLIIINQSPTYLAVRADVVISDDVSQVIPAIAAKVLQ